MSHDPATGMADDLDELDRLRDEVRELQSEREWYMRRMTWYKDQLRLLVRDVRRFHPTTTGAYIERLLRQAADNAARDETYTFNKELTL